MIKTELVEQLISNELTSWKEEDRELLMQTDDDLLLKMIPVANEKDEEEDKEEDVVDNTEPTKPSTVEDYINNAPEEMQDVLRNGLNAYKSEKAKLITVITSNKRNAFSKEELVEKSIQELRKLSAMIDTPVKNARYDGQADGEDITDNKEEALVMPTMNFEK